ncbi:MULTISPECIES: FKBP-type peptidyl-prolyl cis-trans isomerase [Marinifilum]|uniref:Peptidyl-prolyl cis-trans isomerase n=1 Tax=Marinifilum flexuosum TaxID=1117708 RepID=A0A419WWV8_9BACT|nr:MULTISPECIES: FKBP-type peptidyl-prolyl cis-trans isomerase [Marinifilum]MCY1634362.1 FKBP-type peptidyl-prolyl cis-trans isomerase [Marinifilum sp. D737]RKD99858.1 FKBP-type peptidyl-prolyl cis-trans isomerase FklB [Marinifilum flexuosum]
MKYTEEQDKVSYCLGLSIASNLITSGVKTISTEPFMEALDAAFNGKMPELSPEEANQILQEFFTKVQEEQAGAAIEAGKKFLAENAKKEGVTALESGLQYEIITEGNGDLPKGTDSVKCHYHGTLIDGTVFDSSVNRGEPATFPVNGVIAGWVEALQLMPVGSKWKLYVPSDLAYGAQGAGNLIGPHTTLIFEVELLEIV